MGINRHTVYRFLDCLTISVQSFPSIRFFVNPASRSKISGFTDLLVYCKPMKSQPNYRAFDSRDSAYPYPFLPFTARVRTLWVATATSSPFCLVFLTNTCSDPFKRFVFCSAFSLSSQCRHFVFWPGACLRFQRLGSSVPAHPFPDTIFLVVRVLVCPRNARLFLPIRCTHYALRCGDAPPLMLE